MAPRVDLDLWDDGFRQLTGEESRHGLLQQLLGRGSAEQRKRVVAWAEATLPFRDGDQDPVPERGGPGQPPAVANELESLVQAMDDAELFNAPMVLALLTSPRPAGALRALASQPRERWRSEITAEVERLAASPKERLAEMARQALDQGE